MANASALLVKDPIIENVELIAIKYVNPIGTVLCQKPPVERVGVFFKPAF
jgi:hypothetical protein